MNNLAPPPETDDVSRALPHAVGPEKSVLSSIFQDPGEFLNLAIEEGITEAHFYLPTHATIYGVMLDFHQANEEIEFVSFVQKGLDSGRLEKMGGPGYLTDIYGYAPSPGHFHHHLTHIRKKFILRSLIRNSNDTVAEAYENPEEADAILDNAERGLIAIREANTPSVSQTVKDDIRELSKELQEEIEGKAKPTGLLTGFEDFDSMTGGLKPGEYTVIAARPSMGKTSLMMNMVEHICIDLQAPTLVFSAEMPRKAIVKRLAYARAKFDINQLSRGHKPVKKELERISRAFQDIHAAPLHIEDKSGPSINEIRAKARRYHRKHGIKLVAIDYLQLCKSSSKQAINSREREIADISAGCKALAKDLNIPVIVLAQINRDADKRSGTSKGQPKMSDLRESGSIEQDADIIGFIYRPSQYADTPEEKQALVGKATFDIAKNRNGATGKIPLTFIEELMRFETGAPFEEDAPVATTRW